MREQTRAGDGSVRPAVALVRRHGSELARDVRATCARTAPLLWFLLAYWLYIDGVNTIIKMAVDYGLSLGFAAAEPDRGAAASRSSSAFPAALAFGWLGKRIGAAQRHLHRDRGLRGGDRLRVLPDERRSRISTLLAVVIGLVQGGIQSLIRSYFAAARARRASRAEFFGFYNMMGKFAAVLGPMLVGFVAFVTGDSRLAILSILILFVGGAALLAVAVRVQQTEHRVD